MGLAIGEPIAAMAFGGGRVLLRRKLLYGRPAPAAHEP